MNEPKAGHVGVAVAMLIVTPMFWAGHSVVARVVASDIHIPTFTLISLRWLMALALFLPFVHRRVWADRWLLIRHWRYVLITSLVGPMLFPIFLYTGLQTTTVTNTSIIQALVPAMVPVIAWMLLRDRVWFVQTIGIAISMAGVFLIITKGQPAKLANLQFVIGDFIILGGFICWSVYTVLIRLKPARMHPNTLLVAGMSIAGFGMLPLWIMEAAMGETIPLSAGAGWSIAYIVIFPTLLSYYFYNQAIAVVGPTKAGLASHLVPPIAILLGVVFLGEALHTYHFISFTAVIIGVVIVIRGGRVSNTRALT